jgi:hypothetical protein
MGCLEQALQCARASLEVLPKDVHLKSHLKSLHAIVDSVDTNSSEGSLQYGHSRRRVVPAGCCVEASIACLFTRLLFVLKSMPASKIKHDLLKVVHFAARLLYVKVLLFQVGILFLHCSCQIGDLIRTFFWYPPELLMPTLFYDHKCDLSYHLCPFPR